MPSNSKINPKTPSRTEIENLINYLKVWSRSDRERTVYIYIYGSGQPYSCGRQYEQQVQIKVQAGWFDTTFFHSINSWVEVPSFPASCNSRPACAAFWPSCKTCCHACQHATAFYVWCKTLLMENIFNGTLSHSIVHRGMMSWPVSALQLALHITKIRQITRVVPGGCSYHNFLASRVDWIINFIL